MLPNQYSYNAGSYARLQQMTRMGNTALATSPQMLPILNAIARMMGGTDFMAMGATEQQLLQTAAGFALDNGLLPGYITNTADTYDDMYQTLFSTGAFRGMQPADFAEAAYAMHSHMNSFIFGADGSVNYMNTGGMSGTLASQVYTRVLGEELAKGNMSMGTVRTNLTGGRTGGAGIATMMRNVNTMVRNGEITYAEGQRYRQAEKAWSNIGNEAEARVRMLMEANPNMSREEALQKATDVEAVRKAREIVTSREGFDQKKFNEEVAKSIHERGVDEALALRLLDSVDEDGDVVDPEGIATDQELIGDRGVGNTLRDARKGNVNAQRVGTVSEVSFRRNEGESVAAYMARLRGLSRDGTLSGDNFDRMSRAALQWEKASADGAFDGKSDKEIINMLLEAGYNELAEIVRSGDTGKMEQFKTEAEELKKKVEARVRKIGESVKVLEEVFGTDDLNELQRYATELGIGSLTDVGNAERMQKSVSNMYDLANYSGRSIESVMLERKSMAKTMASMSGGKQFVSEAELNYMQILNQQSLADDANGELYSTEERFAMTMRSHANAEKHFLGWGAARHVLKDMPGLLTDKDRADFEAKVARIDELMQSENPEDREEAKRLSLGLSRRLEEGYNLDPRTQRLYYNKAGYDITMKSMRNGANLQFNQRMQRMVENGTISKSEAASVSDAFKLRTELFGSDTAGFNRLVNKVSGLSGSELDEAVANYMEQQGIDAGSEEGKNVAALARRVAGMSAAGNKSGAHALSVLQNQTIAQGLVGSVTMAGVRKKAWEAFQMSGLAEGAGREGSVMDSILRAYFTGGQEATLGGYLSGEMFQAIRDKGDAEWENAKDPGKRETYLKELMSNGGGAVLSGLDAKGRVTIDAKVALASLDAAHVKVTKEQRKALLKASGTADKYAILRDIVDGADGRLAMVDNHVVYASAKQIEEASKKSKEIQELMSLDMQDAIGAKSEDGRKVTKDELVKIGLKDSDFDKDDNYIGSMSVFQNMDKTKILDMLNKIGANGKTFAEEIAENKDKSNPVDAIKKKMDDLCGYVENIEKHVSKEREQMTSPATEGTQGGTPSR